jgi:hypothetical protein
MDCNIQQAGRSTVGVLSVSEKLVVHCTDCVFIETWHVRRDRKPVLRENQPWTQPIAMIRCLIRLAGKPESVEADSVKAHDFGNKISALAPTSDETHAVSVELNSPAD